jgi:hypothetical protein
MWLNWPVFIERSFPVIINPITNNPNDASSNPRLSGKLSEEIPSARNVSHTTTKNAT